ncbi:proteasome maturation protein [Nilaparvata lugens]|uniref:proteasome maturation protein n=1 Tax=Nilaparvata lugens TaxID=108931 RepID=UPI000B9829AC|nr:proteasome maturation protein [Nilaparvata lugens]
MDFGLPPLKEKSTGFHRQPNADKQNEYGIPDPMTFGLGAARPTLYQHPLETSERNYQKNQQRLHMAVMRNTQGIHAPLRVAMELKAFENVGHLPFLPSSNFSRDVILGNDETLDFSDILNTTEFRETRPHPHALMEHKLGIL